MTRVTRLRRKRSGQHHKRRHYRRLRLESLESRRVLAVYTVTNLSDGPVAATGDLPGSLRQAIFDANANPGADTIEFQSGVTGTILLNSGELAITDSVTVNGPGAAELTIDAQNNSRVLYIDDGDDALLQSVSVSGIVITGGGSFGFPPGGGIFTYENLTIIDSNIFDNKTGFPTLPGKGAGIYSRHGQVTIIDSAISGNINYFGRGGGIHTEYGNLTITNSIMSNNRTFGDTTLPGKGAGIYSRYAQVTIIDSTISGNSANGRGRGGGVYIHDADLTITNSTISGNSAANGIGGGIYSLYGDSVTITNSVISGNTADRGGGIEIHDADLTITNSTISGNTAGRGGGINSHDDISLTITNSVIYNNYAAGSGGGIFARYGNLTITNSTISGNAAGGDSSGEGGAIVSVDGQLTIVESTISGNSANYEGGGIFSKGTTTITNSTISGNTAFHGTGGGGIHNAEGLTVVQHSTITENSSVDGEGSGVASAGNATTVTEVLSSIISGNVGSDVGYVDGSQPAYTNSFVSNGFNLIGYGNAVDDATFVNDDLTGVADPMLGPLADNLGPTLTHAVLQGSPALDAGDPNAMAGVGNTPMYDQRGMPFTRVYDGDAVIGARIDIGAFETQPVMVDGDFNDDGLYDCLDIDALVGEIAAATNDLAFDLTGDRLVNLTDRDAWLAEAGENNLGPGEVYSLGDANLDGFVDALDFIEWNANKFTSVAEWCAGDFNADHLVDALDFIIWNANKFQNSDQIPMQPPRLTRAATEHRGARHEVQEDLGVDSTRVISPITVPVTHRVDATFANSRRSNDGIADDHDVNALKPDGDLSINSYLL